jgi:16S rRNA (cytidine1402-2'-O)-methyltransferase
LLTLIPTPIDDESPLGPTATGLLNDMCLKDDVIIAVEELKEGRRRWLRFGLPRDAIDKFELYNEHTHKDQCQNLLAEMQKGKKVFLMSDCGLPAFCDPGRRLVELCHQHGIPVTSTPFSNSIALAVALSGFDHSRFIFEGFVSAKQETRKKELQRIMQQKETMVLMDTPYRMKKLIDELALIDGKREAMIAIELNQSNERLFRASLSKLAKKIEKEKHEFVLVIGPKNVR